MIYRFIEMTEDKFEAILRKKETTDCLVIHAILEVYGNKTFKELWQFSNLPEKRIYKAIHVLSTNNLIQSNHGKQN